MESRYGANPMKIAVSLKWRPCYCFLALLFTINLVKIALFLNLLSFLIGRYINFKRLPAPSHHKILLMPLFPMLKKQSPIIVAWWNQCSEDLIKVTQELQAFRRNKDNPSSRVDLSYLWPNYFIVCFLNINTAVYGTCVVFVQNRKRFGWPQELFKNLKIKLLKMILCVRFLHQIYLKTGFYLVFHNSSSNYDARI